MKPGAFWKLERLNDDALEQRLRTLLAAGSRTEAHVVAHLAEVEARRLHLLQGFESLFDYCKKALGLSGNEAFYRIVAARMCKRFPSIFGLLEQRELFITTLPLLRDYISHENHAELLEQVRGKSKAEVLELLATRVPRPDARSHIRRLPTSSRSVSAGPTGSLEPLSAVSYRLQLNTSHTLKEKLELARDLMAHSNPNGDLAVVVERALELLIAQLQARRFGATTRPQQNRQRLTASKGAPDFEHSKSEQPVKPDTREPDTRDTREPDTRDTREPDTRDTREPDTRDTREPNTRDTREPNTREPDTRDTREPDTRDTREPDTRDTREPDTREPELAKKSRSARPHIPHEIRRQVLARDGLQCTFTATDGRRCEARAFLELDHQRAWAHGGSHAAENLRVLCARHNALHAEQCFGAPRIKEVIAQRRQRTG